MGVVANMDTCRFYGHLSRTLIDLNYSVSREPAIWRKMASLGSSLTPPIPELTRVWCAKLPPCGFASKMESAASGWTKEGLLFRLQGLTHGQCADYLACNS